jgi:ATP-binding cassette subfamily B protein
MLVFFSATFLLISIFSKNKINKISKFVSSISGKRIKSIQEIIGYLRQILLGNSSGFFIDDFKKKDFYLRKSNLKISIYSSLPKIFIETLGIILVCIVIVISITYLSYEENNLIISLSVIGYGFQKLLFIFNQLYLSWVTCASMKHRAYDVVCLLELNEKSELQHHKIATITDKIQFSNVDFKYNNSSYVFKKINLTIKKNSIIGIVGSSGSGKTTLLDLFCGLLSPTKGKILIDNKNIIDFLETWKKSIAYVPQNVFLTDKSIKENIAFTDDKNNINFDKIILASKQTLCFDFINKLPKKFNTLIGKNGVRLSGGQAQRIAFARAIYADFDVLLLDEVTSALDSNNEKKILHFLKNQLNNKTILMASHKISCLKICDSIILIKNKNLFYYPSLKKYLFSKN